MAALPVARVTGRLGLYLARLDSAGPAGPHQCSRRRRDVGPAGAPAGRAGRCGPTKRPGKAPALTMRTRPTSEMAVERTVSVPEAISSEPEGVASCSAKGKAPLVRTTTGTCRVVRGAVKVSSAVL